MAASAIDDMSTYCWFFPKCGETREDQPIFIVSYMSMKDPIITTDRKFMVGSNHMSRVFTDIPMVDCRAIASAKQSNERHAMP